MGLVMLILMPLFMMGMVGYIFPSNSGMSNVPVAIANLDAVQGNASLSTKFVAQLEALNNKTGNDGSLDGRQRRRREIEHSKRPAERGHHHWKQFHI